MQERNDFPLILVFNWFSSPRLKSSANFPLSDCASVEVSVLSLTPATRANIDGTNLARWVKNSWMREGLPVNVGKEKNTKKPFSPALVVAKQKYDDTW